MIIMRPAGSKPAGRPVVIRPSIRYSRRMTKTQQPAKISPIAMIKALINSGVPAASIALVKQLSTAQRATLGYFAEDETTVDAYLELNAEQIRLAIEDLCDAGLLIPTGDGDFEVAA